MTLSHAFNTYSGGTGLDAGTLELAAVQAAGIGAITFATGSHAKLRIDNAALSGHHFTNEIDLFGKHDVLDLAGLHFHAGATAIYHKASHHLAVDSGGVIDTLTLLSPLGAHFSTASDHHGNHGGTEVFLFFA
jgi:autotransporter-associated beta strand protein